MAAFLGVKVTNIYKFVVVFSTFQQQIIYCLPNLSFLVHIIDILLYLIWNMYEIFDDLV